jgi:hypothetical protein
MVSREIPSVCWLYRRNRAGGGAWPALTSLESLPPQPRFAGLLRQGTPKRRSAGHAPPPARLCRIIVGRVFPVPVRRTGGRSGWGGVAASHRPPVSHNCWQGISRAGVAGAGCGQAGWAVWALTTARRFGAVYEMRQWLSDCCARGFEAYTASLLGDAFLPFIVFFYKILKGIIFIPGIYS